MRDASVRWSGVAALCAGVVWLVVWAHQARAHGTTQLNEEELVFGLTWMDSAKFLVAPFALLVPAVAALRARSDEHGRLGRAALATTYIALAALVVGTALEFWSFAWGSYAGAFDEPLPTYGGLVQILGSFAFTLGSVLLAVALGRQRVLPIWIGIILVAGAATTVYLTPVLPVPGVAWLVLGAFLWRGQALPVARASR